ncbi:AAA family ATPase [Sorangium sp. So ce295]|jgi:hypothetical protein|uniref:AAA family ATPase n=1 Tax=Sorangium sp. So ce295 TaxID=3133295 RepID=UPI003F601F99
MLRALHIKDVGPAARFDLELGERLNVLTGDNGLGKSFVLEVAWWALTGTWLDRPVLPQYGREESAAITGELCYKLKRNRGEHAPREDDYTFEAKFNRIAQGWDFVPSRRSLPEDGWVSSHRGLDVAVKLELARPVLYVGVNGALSLWDPARVQPREEAHGRRIASAQAYHFSQQELWNGLEREGKTLCNGLIHDWVTWQLEAEAGHGAEQPFDLLRLVLQLLSHPDEPMIPGKPVRLYLDDVRRIPTIDLPYAAGVPVVHASAGMRQILSLSYLIVWAWTEHVRASRIIGWPPADRMVLLVEEPEVHLHPKWQRHIVPALLQVLSGLKPVAEQTQAGPLDQTPAMRPQVLLTTHAPLVLASLEPHFDGTWDKLFTFELKEGRNVELEERPWTKYGDAVGWLTSEVFDLPEARSPEAERAIAAAYDFMAGRHERLPEHLNTGAAIHAELQRVLADQDPFWPQWLFARQGLKQ